MMDKKLTRTDYMFSLFFIFMLVSVLGAFFYGLKLGTERIEAKQQALIDKKAELAQGQTAYNQSYLVSFYHTIYLPYKEFEAHWFKSMNDIEVRGSSLDPASIIKDIGKVADEKYNTLLSQSMPSTSPLLQDGLQNYLKSLKLFNEAAKNFQANANSLQGSLVSSQIEKDVYFSEAKMYALLAQKNFFDSIVKWNQTLVLEPIKGLDLIKNVAMTITDWNLLSLNVKNDFITSLMLSNKYFKPYTPQDLVIRIDEMIKSGQAKKLNASTVVELADILVGTGAVRSGDFINGKIKWYGQETLPQLPFFFNPA